MKIQVLNVPNHAGQTEIKTDSKGVPLDRFWRRRLRDSAIDSCLKVVSKKKRKEKVQ